MTEVIIEDSGCEVLQPTEGGEPLQWRAHLVLWRENQWPRRRIPVDLDRTKELLTEDQVLVPGRGVRSWRVGRQQPSYIASVPELIFELIRGRCVAGNVLEPADSLESWPHCRMADANVRRPDRRGRYLFGRIDLAGNHPGILTDKIGDNGVNVHLVDERRRASAIGGRSLRSGPACNVSAERVQSQRHIVDKNVGHLVLVVRDTRKGHPRTRDDISPVFFQYDLDIGFRQQDRCGINSLDQRHGLGGWIRPPTPFVGVPHALTHRVFLGELVVQEGINYP